MPACLAMAAAVADVIAGQHHDFDTHRLQPLYRLCGTTSQPVGDGEIAENFKTLLFARVAYAYDSFAFGLENSY